MGEHMSLQTARIVESFWAGITSIWLLTGVDKFVLLLMTWKFKRLITEVAGVHGCCNTVDISITPAVEFIRLIQRPGRVGDAGTCAGTTVL